MIAAEALVIFTPFTLPGDAGGTEKGEKINYF